MSFNEDPGNTAARGCNGAERSKWRDAGVDPELLEAPVRTPRIPAQRLAEQVVGKEAVLVSSRPSAVVYAGAGIGTERYSDE